MNVTVATTVDLPVIGFKDLKNHYAYLCGEVTPNGVKWSRKVLVNYQLVTTEFDKKSLKLLNGLMDIELPSGTKAIYLELS